MGSHTPRRPALAALIVSLALAGCGSGAHKGSGGTSNGSGGESQTAKAEAARGRAAGEALTCVSQEATHKSARGLVAAYEYMLKGEARTPKSSPCPALPDEPLSANAAKAATAVVKAYAERIATHLDWSATERELLRLSEL